MSVTYKADGRPAGRASKPRLASALALLWTGVSSAVMLAAAAPCAQAEEQAQRFDIPAQPLSTALLEFARQAQVELFLPRGMFDGVNAREVRGVHRPSIALSRLLEGTGFSGRLEDGVVQLRRAPPAAPVRVRRLPDPPRPPQTETVVRDDIVVVGANIRGLYPSSSPIDIYTARDIARTGAVTTEHFVDTLTQNLDTRIQYGPGSTNPGNSEGVNGIDLRGLGLGASLVLVNGRRPPLASRGQTVDLSLIPLSAIDRVEVLTDGASAIYGSDAIGGVVNFVLKSEVEHPETRIDFGTVTDGGLRSGGIAHTFGGRWDGGATLLSLSAQSASALERTDRDFAAMAGRGDLSPEDVRYSLLGSFSVDATSHLSLSGDLLAGLRNVKVEFEIPELQAFVTSRTEAESLFANLRVDYNIGEELQASLNVTHSKREDEFRQRFISAAGVETGASDTEYSSLDATAKLEGRFGRLPGGGTRFSVGGGRLEERFWMHLSGYDLARSMTYVFGEAFAPILGKENSVAFVRRLELSVAARYTDYSDESQPPLTNDFGDHISPKFGLLWAPADWLSLRGSFSESFRAPSLLDLDPANAFNALIVTTLRGAETVALGTFGPPPNLRPETAKTYTAGFDLEAPFEPRFRIRATYFNIDYHDRIAMPDLTSGVAPFADPDSFSDILFATGSVTLIEEILRSTTNTFNATSIDFSDPRSAAAQLAALPNFVVFDDRLRNLDHVRLDGFDLDVAHNLIASWGELILGARLSYVADYQEKISANAPTTTVVDTVLHPVDLRARAYMEFVQEGMDAVIALNYVDDYRNPYGVGQQRVDSWITWDVHARFDLEHAGGALDGLSLSFAVQNLFDRDPPFVTQGAMPGVALSAPVGFDRTNASPIGRFVSVGLVKRW